MTWPLWVLVSLLPSLFLCACAVAGLIREGQLRSACKPPRSGALSLVKRKG